MTDKGGQVIDSRKVADIEKFRDYFDTAADLAPLEKCRSRIERTDDLETLHPLLENAGPVFLPGFLDSYPPAAGT